MFRTKVQVSILAVGMIVGVAATPATAADITAGSCSQAHIQAAVNAATDGATVNVPAGNCTWSGTEDLVKVENKNITIRGAGVGNTVITRNGNFIFYVIMTGADRGNVRITGFTFQGETTGSVFEMRSMSYNGIPSGRWRIDNNHFNYPTGQRVGVAVDGVNYGVFDHNTVTWSAGQFLLSHGFLDSETNSVFGDLLNQQPLDYGTDKFVFVEDNTFTPGGSSPVNVFDAAGGARLVYRYNTCTGCFLYNHWTRGQEMAGHVFEIYNNSWIGNSAYGIAVGAGYPVRLEGGTAVIYNNYAANFHQDGVSTPYVFLDDRRADGSESAGLLSSCNGSQPWDGNIESNGWPCLGQIGRAPGKSFAQLKAGQKQASSPVYLWNNGSEPTCATGGACTNTWGVYGTPGSHIKATPHVNGDVDYVLGGKTAKPGYTPYVYPHPRVTGVGSGGNVAGPPPPSNVHVLPNS